MVEVGVARVVVDAEEAICAPQVGGVVSPNCRRATHGGIRLDGPTGPRGSVPPKYGLPGGYGGPGIPIPTPLIHIPRHVVQAHIRSAQNSPPDSCREVRPGNQLRIVASSAPNRSVTIQNAIGDHRNSWPGFQKSCCPTETAARSTRPAPPSPTPLPSATDSRWPPSSHKPSSDVPIRINLRQPRIRVIHRRQPRLLRPRIAPLHHSHTNPPSAPDDSPPCPHPAWSKL